MTLTSHQLSWLIFAGIVAVVIIAAEITRTVRVKYRGQYGVSGEEEAEDADTLIGLKFTSTPEDGKAKETDA